MSTRRRNQLLARALDGDRSAMVTRVTPMLDFHIRTKAQGGDGRTVDAYAAVFNVPAEVLDDDGHYEEQNDPRTFTKSVSERFPYIFSVYNHARTLGGQSSDLWSVPVGTPLVIKPDAKGLFTSTRYNADDDSMRIFEAIKNESLKGMSYTGVFLRSTPELTGPFDQYGPDSSGQLPLVTRLETALIEYGPTPIPTFDTASVVGVRSREVIRMTGTQPAAARAASPVHHTPVMNTPYDSTSPGHSHPAGADRAYMQSMYALYQDAGEAQGGFVPEAGAFPHHQISADGTVGPANVDACRQAIDDLDTDDSYSVEEKSQAADHLQAHLDDFEQKGSMTVVTPGPDNATNHENLDKTVKHPANSAGRKAEGDPAERSQDPAEGQDDDQAEDQAEDQDAVAKLVAAGMTPEQAAAMADGGNEGEQGDRPDDTGEVEPDRSAEPADGEPAERAASVDDSSWDAGKVWSAGVSSDSPAKFYAAVCAGRKAGDATKQGAWALPHHYKPGDPPNAHGVSAALSRFSSTQGLVNSSAAKAHLEAHQRVISGAHGTDDTKGTSSSGRNPAAAPLSGAGHGTGIAPGHHAGPPFEHPASSVSTNNGSRSMNNTDRMTIDERAQRLGEVRTRLSEIDSEYMGSELPNETRQEWEALQGELVLHDRALKDATARAQYLRTVSENSPADGYAETIDNIRTGFGDMPDSQVPPAFGGGSRSDSGGRGSYADRNGNGSPTFYRPQAPIYDLAAIRNRARSWEEVPVLYREFAYRAVDAARFPGSQKCGRTRESCQETVTHLIDSIDDEQGTLARRVLTTGSPVYDRAFGKALQSLNVNALTNEESRALQLGVDSFGGYAVPFQLDPTVILTSNGAINPLRQIARTEQITGKEWDGVTSAGVTVTRVAEGTEAGTGDPALVQPKVRTTRVQGFIPFNIELDVSWGALRSQMTNLLMDAKDVEEATAFITGNGVAPQAGGLVNTMATTSIVFTQGTATLAIADLYAVENAMAPRFRQQASYLASKTTFNRFRQLFQALASAAFDSWVRPSGGTPATFNGYPAFEESAMDITISSGSHVMLMGDFSQYLIVDRVGMGIELIPHLFGPTNRYPLGQRGILAIWFNNATILVPNAFRMLQTL